MSRYACIVGDPPWQEHGGCNRGADAHYPTLSTKEIARVMLGHLSGRVANAAHLWLWVTDNFLEDGLGLIERLGFAYTRTYFWVKLADRDITSETGLLGLTSIDIAEDCLQIGLGQYARGSHELCLFATSGNAAVPAPADRPPSVLFAPREEHSRKPLRCYTEWFEQVSPGPRLEMFARRRREDWDAWGNEVPEAA